MRHTTGKIFEHVIHGDAHSPRIQGLPPRLPGSIVMMPEYVISLTLFENLVPGNEKRAFPSEVTCPPPPGVEDAALPTLYGNHQLPELPGANPPAPWLAGRRRQGAGIGGSGGHRKVLAKRIPFAR
jgi:hypothetical protein